VQSGSVARHVQDGYKIDVGQKAGDLRVPGLRFGAPEVAYFSTTMLPVRVSFRASRQ
jgi:hypothetical protein